MVAAAELDGLKKLEYLSLVSKVCTELESHLGFSDKVLAEFITELGRNCLTVEEFDSKLKDNGAEMPDYFVRTLLKIIHAILPPDEEGVKEKKRDDVDGDGRKEKYQGLAIRNDVDRIKEIEKEIENELKEKEKERERDRGRDGERSRYRERDEGGRGDRDRRRDRYDREDRRKDWGKEDDDRRERHRDRDMRDKRYGDEDEDGQDRRRGGALQEREPELYKVYKGRVLRAMESGCFVQLTDFKGKEGMVHVSQLASRRIGNVKDVVKRDQEVFVKVISMTGQKLSLSMKDVDQHTGEDLLPLKKNSDEDGSRTNPAGGRDGPRSRTGLSRFIKQEIIEQRCSSCMSFEYPENF